MTLVLDAWGGGRREGWLETNILPKPRFHQNLCRVVCHVISKKKWLAHLSIDVGNLSSDNNSLNTSHNLHPSKWGPLSL